MSDSRFCAGSKGEGIIEQYAPFKLDSGGCVLEKKMNGIDSSISFNVGGMYVQGHVYSHVISI